MGVGGEKRAERRDRLALPTLLRDAAVSAHERVVKPDRAIFVRLLERNGLSARDCIFIDDSAANVAAAAGRGFDAIRFEDASRLRAALHERGLPA